MLSIVVVIVAMVAVYAVAAIAAATVVSACACACVWRGASLFGWPEKKVSNRWGLTGGGRKWVTRWPATPVYGVAYSDRGRRHNGTDSVLDVFFFFFLLHYTSYYILLLSLLRVCRTDVVVILTTDRIMYGLTSWGILAVVACVTYGSAANVPAGVPSSVTGTLYVNNWYFERKMRKRHFYTWVFVSHEYVLFFSDLLWTGLEGMFQQRGGSTESKQVPEKRCECQSPELKSCVCCLRMNLPFLDLTTSPGE